MSIIIRDKNKVYNDYQGFMSEVDGLFAAALFGNSDVDSTLRKTMLNASGLLGVMQEVYSAGITLQDTGGITLAPAGAGDSAARILAPYTPVDNGEGCVTVVCAVNTPTYVQLYTYAGWRIIINGTGGIVMFNSVNTNLQAGVSLNLVDRGYMTSTEGLKTCLLVVEVRLIEGSGTRMTVSLHDANGNVITSGYGGVSGGPFDITLYTPYWGGVAVGASTYKAQKQYGNLVFHRQLTDAEKVTAAAQLARYANTFDAAIA